MVNSFKALDELLLSYLFDVKNYAAITYVGLLGHIKTVGQDIYLTSKQDEHYL